MIVTQRALVLSSDHLVSSVNQTITQHNGQIVFIGFDGHLRISDANGYGASWSVPFQRSICTYTLVVFQEIQNTKWDWVFYFISSVPSMVDMVNAVKEAASSKQDCGLAFVHRPFQCSAFWSSISGNNVYLISSQIFTVYSMSKTQVHSQIKLYLWTPTDLKSAKFKIFDILAGRDFKYRNKYFEEK